jgi:type II secretory ATPase GspE/PulE/Tfp pilus assembly ATPase PilB-like protein
VCPACRTSYQPDEDVLRELGPDAQGLRGVTLHYGKGCDECFHTGYRGRTAICEIMRIDPALRRAILERASTAEIRERARAAGMRTLRDSGLRAVLAGVTTIEEVRRETMGL